MKRRIYPILFMIPFLATPLACRKWITKEVRPRDQGNSQPPPVIIGGNNEDEGQIAVTLKRIQKDDQSHFKDCIRLEVSGQETKVGCNKLRDPNDERYLTTETPYVYKVPKGSSQQVGLSFKTWLPASPTCIRYGDPACNGHEPYKGENQPDATRSVPGQGIKCFKKRDADLYHIYFEDQIPSGPGDNYDLDARVRARLRSQTGGAVAAFDPLASDRDAVYISTPKEFTGAGTDCVKAWIADRSRWAGNPTIAAELGRNPNSVPERALQACFGIDYSDLILDLEGVDATISIGATDCMTVEN